MDFEKMSALEVQNLARLGDKQALYEMIWRYEELLPVADRDNPVERCAWQDYWFEKASDAGHVDAISRFTQSLINRVMNADDRKKAMKYLQNLVDDFDAGKLSQDEQEDGVIAKLRLGIMLCEGYHAPPMRDTIQGVKLIKEAHELTNGFVKYGFGVLAKLGELYATGLAQPGEEASIADLEIAIEYLDKAIKSLDPQKANPRNFDLAKQLLETTQKRIVTKKEIKAQRGEEDLIYPDADKRRNKIMELSDAAQQRVDADKAALKRLRERLASEGW